MSSPVIVADLEARWRPLSDAEFVVAQSVLDDAMSIVTTRRPSIMADIAIGTVTSEALVFVVCAMALRVLKNPDGKGEESIDDYRYKRDAAIASGQLYVSNEELRLVTGALIPRVRGVRMLSGGELL
jgi:hypothetical protein